MIGQTSATNTQTAKLIFARPNPDQADLRRRWVLEEGEIASSNAPDGYVDVKTVRTSRNGMHKVTAFYRIHRSQVITYLWGNNGAADTAKAAPATH